MVFNNGNTILKAVFEKEKIKILSKSTFHKILTNTDNNALERVFRDYFWDYITQNSVATDGKWLQKNNIAVLQGLRDALDGKPYVPVGIGC